MITIGNDQWFVAGDACRILGVNVTRGTYMALSKLDQHEKQPFLIGGSGNAKLTLISESGLYESDKPEAKAF